MDERVDAWLGSSGGAPFGVTHPVGVADTSFGSIRWIGGPGGKHRLDVH
jgi:hypothetical protein